MQYMWNSNDRDVELDLNLACVKELESLPEKAVFIVTVLGRDLRVATRVLSIPPSTLHRWTIVPPARGAGHPRYLTDDQEAELSAEMERKAKSHRPMTSEEVATSVRKIKVSSFNFH